jgi:hypothetical protein
MKSRKNKNPSRIKMNGGFLFRSKASSLGECEVSNLSSLSKASGDGQDPLSKMRENYVKCCPKDFMGRKKSSAYCNQLDMNFKALSQHAKDIDGYYGDETDVSKIKQIMDEPVPTPVANINTTYKKPWYKFWGGKKTKKRRKTRRRGRTVFYTKNKHLNY